MIPNDAYFADKLTPHQAPCGFLHGCAKHTKHQEPQPVGKQLEEPGNVPEAGSGGRFSSLFEGGFGGMKNPYPMSS